MKNYNSKRDIPGEYFPMPKAIFRLDLDAGEIAVLAFLMYCEDRKTFTCHPSYATIGSALGMSNNTVKKYVDSLERKGFIYTEPTMVRTRDGRAITAACNIPCNRSSLSKKRILKSKSVKPKRERGSIRR